MEGLQSFSPSLCPLARFQISLMFHNFSLCDPQHSHSKPEGQATVLYPLTYCRHHWESICFKNGIKSKNDTIFNISLRKRISSKQLAVTYCSVGSAVSLPGSTCVVQGRLHCDVTRWGQRTDAGAAGVRGHSVVTQTSEEQAVHIRSAGQLQCEHLPVLLN